MKIESLPSGEKPVGLECCGNCKAFRSAGRYECTDPRHLIDSEKQGIDPSMPEPFEVCRYWTWDNLRFEKRYIQSIKDKED
jgi:hypothetical protein